MFLRAFTVVGVDMIRGESEVDDTILLRNMSTPCTLTMYGLEKQKQD